MSEERLSIFTTQAPRQAVTTNIGLNYSALASVRESLSEITSAREGLANNRVFHSLGYERTLSRSHASTMQQKI